MPFGIPQSAEDTINPSYVNNFKQICGVNGTTKRSLKTVSIIFYVINDGMQT